MIPCALCTRPIYPGERFDTFGRGAHAHLGCIEDYLEDKLEESEASGA